MPMPWQLSFFEKAGVEKADKGARNERQSSPGASEQEGTRAKMREMQRMQQMRKELEKRLGVVQTNLGELEKEVAGERRSKADKEAVKAEWAKKEQEATEFVGKMQQATEEWKTKFAEKTRLLAQKAQQEAEEREKQAKKEAERVLELRKEKTRQLFQRLKQKREAEHLQQEALKQTAESAAPLKPDQYVYHKLEKRYQSEVVVPLLEFHKQQLANKRLNLKPISLAEIEEHKKKFEQIMQEREEKRLQEQRKKQEEDDKLVELQKQYKSKISSKVERYDQQAKQLRHVQQVHKTQMRSKMLTYANVVKEECPVQRSEHKAAELHKLIEGLKHKGRQPRDVRDNYAPSKLCHRSSTMSQSKPVLNASVGGTGGLEEAAKMATTHESDAQTLVARRQRSRTQLRPRLPPVPTTQAPNQDPYPESYDASNQGQDSNSNSRPKQSQEEAPKAKGNQKPNYLAELAKRRQRYYSVSRLPKQNWQVDIANDELSIDEKYSRITSKASMLERHAQLKARFSQTDNGQRPNLGVDESATEMYVDAIKAKLALLEQL
jgi:hypothetical protein